MTKTTFLDYDARPTVDDKYPYCCRCQKPIKGKIKYFLNFLKDVKGEEGFPMILHPSEDKNFKKENIESLDIGPDCAKQVGFEWVHRK